MKSFIGQHHVNLKVDQNEAGYKATLVTYGWAGAELKKVTRAYGQEQ